MQGHKSFIMPFLSGYDNNKVPSRHNHTFYERKIECPSRIYIQTVLQTTQKIHQNSRYLFLFYIYHLVKQLFFYLQWILKFPQQVFAFSLQS